MIDAVRLEGLEKTFANGYMALRGVDLSFARRKLTTLLGPSGCGKSTLLRLVAGLEKATAGRVFIGGADVTALGPESRPISMVFQSYALFPHLSVRANVAFGLDRRCPVGERAAQIGEALKLVGMAAFADRSPGELSGGQQQRVALARALVLAPDVLLLDEPLSNLDAHLRRQIRDDIRNLQQHLGLTVIYVTHDQDEAMAVSDHLVVMRDGQVQQEGSPRSLYEQPCSEFVAAFMGDAAVFDVDSSHHGQLFLGPFRLNLVPTRDGFPMRVVVRPEAWRLAAASGQGMAGRIDSHAYEGRVSHYRVLSALGLLHVRRLNEHQHLQVGAPVSVFLDGPGVSLLSGRAAAPSTVLC